MMERVWPRCTRVLSGVALTGLLTVPAASEEFIVPTEVPTITEALTLAAPGDDVAVLQGSYWEARIPLKGGVRVRGVLGSGLTRVFGNGVDPVFICHDQDLPVTLEGLSLIGGNAFGVWSEGWGGGLQVIRSTVLLRSCQIEQCAAIGGAGVGIDGGTLTMEGCVVRNNHASEGFGGILGWQSQLTVVDCNVVDNNAGLGGGLGGEQMFATIRRCLVASNTTHTYGDGSGVFLFQCTAVIEDCTIVANRGWQTQDGAITIDGASRVDIARTAIANNYGVALDCGVSEVTVACSNFHGNTVDSFCGVEGGGNFSADPLFCDSEGGDYSLDADSPCLPGQHPDGADCGLIGAFGEGCGGSTPVENSSWGRIKELYRNQ
jgi:hypothetical protein